MGWRQQHVYFFNAYEFFQPIGLTFFQGVIETTCAGAPRDP